jgi:hypothetical protein
MSLNFFYCVSTITSKVEVYAPADTADTLPLFRLFTLNVLCGRYTPYISTLLFTAYLCSLFAVLLKQSAMRTITTGLKMPLMQWFAN